MKRFSLSTAMLVVLTMGCPSVFAAEVELKQTAQPVSHATIRNAIDIVGIKPGQSAEEVKGIMKDAGYTLAEEKKGTVGLEYKTAKAQSTPFLKVMKFVKDKERIEIYFGMPTIGGGVVAISREMKFTVADNPPILEDIVKKSIDKYGTPTNFEWQKGRGYLSTVWAFWAYDARNDLPTKTIEPCAGMFCINTNPYNGGPDTYEHSLKSGNQFRIGFNALPIQEDLSRASSLEYGMSDTINIYNMYKEASDQLMRAAKDEYDKSVSAPSTPKL